MFLRGQVLAPFRRHRNRREAGARGEGKLLGRRDRVTQAVSGTVATSMGPCCPHHAVLRADLGSPWLRTAPATFSARGRAPEVGWCPPHPTGVQLGPSCGDLAVPYRTAALGARPRHWLLSTQVKNQGPPRSCLTAGLPRCWPAHTQLGGVPRLPGGLSGGRGDTFSVAGLVVTLFADWSGSVHWSGPGRQPWCTTGSF